MFAKRIVSINRHKEEKERKRGDFLLGSWSFSFLFSGVFRRRVTGPGVRSWSLDSHLILSRYLKRKREKKKERERKVTVGIESSLHGAVRAPFTLCCTFPACASWPFSFCLRCRNASASSSRWLWRSFPVPTVVEPGSVYAPARRPCSRQRRRLAPPPRARAAPGLSYCLPRRTRRCRTPRAASHSSPAAPRRSDVSPARWKRKLQLVFNEK